VYENVAFASTTGLNEVIQLSKTGVGQQLAGAASAQVVERDAQPV